MTDLEIIKQLEKELKTTFKEVPISEIMEYKSSPALYSLDEQGYVNGLHIEGLEFKTIPPPIAEFKHLTQLRISSAGLKDISLLSSPTGFKNLLDLNLSANQISDISPLKELKSLTYIDLESNQISDISPLKELKSLTQLWFGKNRISDISALKDLKSLTTIYLRFNQISDISALKDLKSLTQLWLSDNQISDICALKDLISLTKLSLGGNQISDISALKNLKSLTVLYLSFNQISDISLLENLKKLTELTLFNNQISDISAIKNLKSLTYIDLSNNPIIKLPEWITDFPKLDIQWKGDYEGSFITFFNNPIESPPIEIVKQGKKAIKAWFQSVIGESKPLNELKLIFVGDGSAGKTSLMKQLLSQKFDSKESQTHGINIAVQEIDTQLGNKLKINMWDFGGQEIMHSTHQFFLSKRCLYILVLDSRKDEKTEYWLKHIENYGLDSPVLVVLNKCDEHPGADLNRKFLCEKYPNIQGFFKISCKSGLGIAEFKTELFQHLLSLKSAQTMWGGNWFRIKNALEEKTDDYISIDDYTAICEQNFVKDVSEQDILLDYLHDLGVMLHFTDLALHDTNVLNPKWLTTAVYRIINSPLVQSRKGEFSTNDLGEILKPQEDEGKKSFLSYFRKGKQVIFNYPRSKYNYIVEIMKKFELCYSVGDKILVPDLLPIEEPDFGFERTDSLVHFVFRYDFFPKSIMPRFIVRRHTEIHKNLVWRTGVVLQSQNYDATAIVKADEEDKKIMLTISGTQKRDFFAILRDTIKGIHSDFKNLDVTEQIPLPQHPDFMVDYHELVGYEIEGIDEYFVGKLRKKYSVKELLNGIIPQEVRNKEAQTINNIHIYGNDNLIANDLENSRVAVNKSKY